MSQYFKFVYKTVNYCLEVKEFNHEIITDIEKGIISLRKNEIKLTVSIFGLFNDTKIKLPEN